MPDARLAKCRALYAELNAPKRLLMRVIREYTIHCPRPRLQPVIANWDPREPAEPDADHLWGV